MAPPATVSFGEKTHKKLHSPQKTHPLCRENRLKRGDAGRARAAGSGDFNMYEKMHDAARARETQGVGLELPSIFIITFIREHHLTRTTPSLPTRLHFDADYLFRIVFSATSFTFNLRFNCLFLFTIHKSQFISQNSKSISRIRS